MGTILNSDGYNSFADLAAFRDRDFFVDKTGFIAKVSARICTGRRLLTVSLPRRFGKAVMAHMLLAYYSRAYRGIRVFDGLGIADTESYARHLNQYDVIYIDMNSVSARYRSYRKKIRKAEGVVSLTDFLEYSVIRDLRRQDSFAPPPC